jgi:hypothetical protein
MHVPQDAPGLIHHCKNFLVPPLCKAGSSLHGGSRKSDPVYSIHSLHEPSQRTQISPGGRDLLPLTCHVSPKHVTLMVHCTRHHHVIIHSIYIHILMQSCNHVNMHSIQNTSAEILEQLTGQGLSQSILTIGLPRLESNPHSAASTRLAAFVVCDRIVTLT